MDLQAYLKILRQRWRAIPIVTLVVVAVAAAITYVMPNVYESQLQFFVSTVDTTDNSQLAQGSDFLQQRVKSYSQLIAAPVVLEPVVKDLKLSMTSDQLAEHVTATVPTDTVLINVAVTGDSPHQAEQVARAIGQEFPQTIANLEKVSSTSSSPVKVTVTKPPTLEPEAVSPRPIRNLILGLAFGLLLGVAMALLRHSLDTRLRTKSDIDAFDEDLAVIASIPLDDDAPKNPLLLETGSLSIRSEPLRALRTNLAFVGTTKRARTIVMTSSLPGEGKTTTAANLGIVLAESGASVCLIEADLRRPRLLEYFGLEGGVGLTDVLIGRAELSQVLQPYGRHELKLLGAGQIPPNPSELLGSPAMRELLQELAVRFDFVLLDAPPMLPVTDSAVLSTLADGALIVVGSGMINQAQLATAVEGLKAVNATILGVALNRVPRNTSGHYYGYEYEYRPRRERADTLDVGQLEDLEVSHSSEVDSADRV